MKIADSNNLYVGKLELKQLQLDLKIDMITKDKLIEKFMSENTSLKQASS